jgi:hypothetical protein
MDRAAGPPGRGSSCWGGRWVRSVGSRRWRTAGQRARSPHIYARADGTHYTQGSSHRSPDLSPGSRPYGPPCSTQAHSRSSATGRRRACNRSPTKTLPRSSCSSPGGIASPAARSCAPAGISTSVNIPRETPPQTRIEDTVLDLVEQARTTDEVISWLTRACQRHATTPPRLLAAAEQRTRLRHRQLVHEVLTDVSDGVASALERRYRCDMERRHGLPTARRGQPIVVAGRRWYADARYERYRVRVELEGLSWAPRR